MSGMTIRGPHTHRAPRHVRQLRPWGGCRLTCPSSLSPCLRQPNPEAPATVFECAPRREVSRVNAAKGGSATMSVSNDLAELKSIVPQYTEMLMCIAIDSIYELHHRSGSYLKQPII